MSRLPQALALLGTFCLSLTIGQDTRYNITLGTLEPKSEEVAGGSAGTSIIAEPLRVSSNAVLHSFSVRIGSIRPESSVHVQVWREVNKAESKYECIRTKVIEVMKVGINEVRLQWYITAGDYIGVSCNGYCPIFKDRSKDFMSMISMNPYAVNFVPGMIMSFTHPPLTPTLSIQVLVELNAPRPPTTVRSTTDLSTTTTNLDRVNTDSTTAKPVEDPQRQQDGLQTLGVWWVLIAAVIVIVLLAISLVLVAACSWRREANTSSREASIYRKQLLSSRPTSTLSGKDAYAGRQISIISQESTGQGLPHSNEMEVVDEFRAATNQAAVEISISPSSRDHVQPLHSLEPVAVVGTSDLGTSDLINDTMDLPPPPPPLLQNKDLLSKF